MPQSSLTQLQKAMYRLSFLAWVLAGTHTNTMSFISSPQTLIRCAAVICATFSKDDLVKNKFGEYGEMQKGWTAEDAKGFIKVLSTPLRAYYANHKDEENV